MREMLHLIRRRLKAAPVRQPRHCAASLSQGDAAYVDLCRRASSEPSVFDNFRRAPAYTNVLEHVNATQGAEYFRLLSANGRARGLLLDAARNDSIGGPLMMRLDNGINISPTTLRYLKVADDVERMFGNLDGADVIEIGVGYGGQCRILDAVFALRSYTLVDLRPVLSLASEFLGHFALRTRVSFLTMNELAPRPYGVAISNYAFSELSREVQETYFRKALAQTPRGYITYNDIAPSEFASLSSTALATRLQGTVLAEEPLTHPKNCVIVWGALPDRTRRFAEGR